MRVAFRPVVLGFACGRRGLSILHISSSTDEIRIEIGGEVNPKAVAQ